MRFGLSDGKGIWMPAINSMASVVEFKGAELICFIFLLIWLWVNLVWADKIMAYFLQIDKLENNICTEWLFGLSKYTRFVFYLDLS